MQIAIKKFRESEVISGDHGYSYEATGIMANKNLWLGVGFSLFVLVGFLLPAPGGMLNIVDGTGYAKDGQGERRYKRPHSEGF